MVSRKLAPYGFHCGAGDDATPEFVFSDVSSFFSSGNGSFPFYVYE
jgi:hypothetical protein